MNDRLNKNIIINTNNLRSSPLTWEGYYKMVEMAISLKINQFLFSNEDFEYRYYIQSRFRKIVKLLVHENINEYIETKLKIHYCINPNFPNKIDNFYKDLNQERIDTIYVKFTSDSEFEKYLTFAQNYKLIGKTSKIGLIVNVNDDLKKINALVNIEDIDSVIVKGKLFYLNSSFQLNVETNYESIIYNQIFSLINLLYIQKNILKTKISENTELMENIKLFLTNYSLNNVIENRKNNNIQHTIINCDNESLMRMMLFNDGKELDDSLLIDAVQKIEENILNLKEEWWLN